MYHYINNNAEETQNKLGTLTFIYFWYYDFIIYLSTCTGWSTKTVALVMASKSWWLQSHNIIYSKWNYETNTSHVTLGLLMAKFESRMHM